MTRRRDDAILEGDWLMFRTPDGKSVLLETGDVQAIWDGLEPGTMTVERASGDPVTVLGILGRFASAYCDHYDLRVRPRARRKSHEAPPTGKVTSLRRKERS